MSSTQKKKKKTKRNYRKEYDNYHGKKEQIKRRDKRNAARNIAKKKGIVKKGDGKDVHHVGGDALNKKSKLKVVDASKNRSYPRKKNAGKKYSTS